MLREPLRAEHVKPRLLGHWGTTPGLNLLYAHLNRVINQRDLNALYVPGPGHGGPGLVANAYTYRLVGGIGAMSAAIGGLDVLVFTGGVGEHPRTVRQRAVERLGFLGAALDLSRNESVHGDSDITAAGAAARTLVITAREDLQIAGEARSLCGPA